MNSDFEYAHGGAEVLWSTAVPHSFARSPFHPLHYSLINALISMWGLHFHLGNTRQYSPPLRTAC